MQEDVTDNYNINNLNLYIMRKFAPIKQRLSNFTKQQIKFIEHTVNNYNYKDVMFTGMKRINHLD
jgi:homospermidine synthase